MCCARIVQYLLGAGYQPLEEETATLARRWGNVSIEEMATGKSARYLQESGQQKDLDFVLSHIDDLDDVYHFAQGQVLTVSSPGFEKLPLRVSS